MGRQFQAENIELEIKFAYQSASTAFRIPFAAKTLLMQSDARDVDHEAPVWTLPATVRITSAPCSKAVKSLDLSHTIQLQRDSIKLL